MIFGMETSRQMGKVSNITFIESMNNVFLAMLDEWALCRENMQLYWACAHKG